MKQVVMSILLTVCFVGVANAQTTELTYQGHLKTGTAPNQVPANGNYDFEFALFDALSVGTQLGSTLSRNGVVVANGVFSVKLDFGNQFPGANRFLEIRVRPAGGGAFVPLTPRQEISNTPYAIRSLNAATADSIPVGGLPAGSGNYIQNQNASAQSANFNISGNGIIGGNLGIGTIAPQQTLHVDGLEILSTGSGAGFKFRNRGSSSSADDWVWYSDSNVARLFRAGFGDTLGVSTTGNVGIGTTAPVRKLHVSGPGIVRSRVNSDSNAGLELTINDQPGWSVAAANGGHFQIFNDAIGQNALFIDKTTNEINIGPIPEILTDRLAVNGKISLLMLTEPSPQFACYVRINVPGAPTGLARLTDCGSSIRYKQNIHSLDSGLKLINRLRPVSFAWKANGRADIGLIAEEVAEVEPLLATYNDKGEVEGVKYDRVGVVLINAVKEQQLQIEQQQKLIEVQQRQIELLRKAVCSTNASQEICKP